MATANLKKERRKKKEEKGKKNQKNPALLGQNKDLCRAIPDSG